MGGKHASWVTFPSLSVRCNASDFPFFSGLLAMTLACCKKSIFCSSVKLGSSAPAGVHNMAKHARTTPKIHRERRKSIRPFLLRHMKLYVVKRKTPVKTGIRTRGLELQKSSVSSLAQQ